MANVKMIRTTSDKVNITDIPIDDGQLIFALDTQEIYIDKDDNRTQSTIGKKYSIEDLESYVFVPNQSYSAGDLIYREGQWYSRKTSGSSSVFTISEWDAISYYIDTSPEAAAYNYGFGTNYYNASVKGVMIGSDNLVTSISSSCEFVSGSKNKIVIPGTSNNAIMGYQNEISATSSSTGGGSNNIIVGSTNKIKDASGSSNNAIFGQSNILQNGYIGSSLIFGSSNTINGSSINYNFVGGYSNSISAGGGTTNFLYGQGNTVSVGGNTGNILMGYQNSLSGSGSQSYSFVTGYSNTISGSGNTGILIEGHSITVSGSGLAGCHFEGYNYNFKGSGGYGAHIEGNGHSFTTTFGAVDGAHIEGSSHTISAGYLNGIHMEGNSNSISSSVAPYVHMEGYSNSLPYGGGYCSHIQNSSNQMVGYNSQSDDYTGSAPSFMDVGGYQNIGATDSQTVRGRYNKPDKPDANDDTTQHLVLIGNGDNENKRSNIVEVGLNDTNINGEILYYDQNFKTPIADAIGWFSPPPSGITIATEAIDPDTSEPIMAINPKIFQSFSDLNTYLQNSTVNWEGLRTHIYNPNTKIYYSIHCYSDQYGTMGNSFMAIRETTNLKSLRAPSIFTTQPNEGDTWNPLASIDLTCTTIDGTSVCVPYQISFNGGGTSNPRCLVIFNVSTISSSDYQYFDVVSESAFKNSEWWLWTSPVEGGSTDWKSENLSLNNIMNYDYAKALQLQYTMDWIASTQDSIKTYRVGSVVIYNSCIYRCTTECADTTWTAAHWEQIGVTKAAFDALEARVAALE